MKIRLFLGGLRAPRPSRGRGYGETRFPHTPAQGLRPHLPGGGGVGEPGSPMLTLALHPHPTPLTEDTRLLPPAGEVGRGAERGERFSHQLFALTPPR